MLRRSIEAGADASASARFRQCTQPYPVVTHCRIRRVAVAVVMRAALLLASSTTLVGAASAQDASGILAPGNAVVTGFSGAQAPAAPQGANPADLTEIDLSGPSARIVDLQAPGAPPQAQLVTAAKPFTATADKVGQVFGVALDDATPPNIYVGATSAYGLPIFAPGPNRGPARARQGAPNASFMPGLFGPAQGGPGSIWRIDGASGQVSLFANVMLDGVANSGAALGGLAFDAASHTLFAVDRGTGMIHGFGLDGAERGRFDHGTQARPAAALPPVAYDPAGRLDITKPAFRTDDPSTWGYAAIERRVFGLGVNAGRLYYAVADGTVWSVSVQPDGSFGADPRPELQVPPWDGESEISKIAFDDQGGMLLAERAAPTGAYDFGALAKEGVGRVLHYQQVSPTAQIPAVPGDQQPTPVSQPMAPSGSGNWQPVPDEYAVGFPGEMRNGNGGVAIGYRYTPSGALDRSACGGFIWSTGEQLRASADQALAARLAAGGPPNVNGLQGNAIELLRPANTPPLQTYFVDYDDKFGDADARGHLGDIAIWRMCGSGQGGYVASFPTPSAQFIPVRGCRPGDFRERNGECCERRFVRGGRCEHRCPPDAIRLPNGECCDPRTVREGRCHCPPGETVLPGGKCCDPRYVRDGRCFTPPPVNTCPRGQILENGVCCTPSPASGQCGQTPPPPCAAGQVLAGGVCCDPANVQNGQCIPLRRAFISRPHHREVGTLPPRRIRGIGPRWHPTAVRQFRSFGGFPGGGRGRR